MPSDVTPEVSIFDRFAATAAAFFSKPWFFVLCVLLILVWAPSFFVIGSIDTWQLIINTATTIVTFLMVALL
jgi:low affinity Fe/Cu permease